MDRNKDLIDELRRLHQKNPFQLKNIGEFECLYTALDTINWYASASFLYKVLNKALRTSFRYAPVPVIMVNWVLS